MTQSFDPPLSVWEEEQIFYREHSKAITAFAYLEQELSLLCSIGVDETAGTLSRVAFFGIESFRSKLEFCARYTEQRLKGDVGGLGEWARLHRACVRASKERNKLAHWIVRVYPNGRQAGERVALIDPRDHVVRMVGPDERPLNEMRNPPHESMTIRKVVEAFEVLNTVNRDLEAFRLGKPRSATATPPKLVDIVAAYRLGMKAQAWLNDSRE